MTVTAKRVTKMKRDKAVYVTANPNAWIRGVAIKLRDLRTGLIVIVPEGNWDLSMKLIRDRDNYGSARMR